MNQICLILENNVYKRIKLTKYRLINHFIAPIGISLTKDFPVSHGQQKPHCRNKKAPNWTLSKQLI